MYKKAMKELGGTPPPHEVKPNLSQAKPATKEASTSRQSSSDTSNNTTDCQTPKNPAKQPKTQVTPPTITNDNSFEPIADLQTAEENMDTDNNGNQQQQASNISPRAHPKGKPQPIHIQGQKINATVKILTIAKIGKTAFTIKQNNEEESTITTESYVAYDDIRNVLKSNNIQFTPSPPKHEKPKTLILKGIKGDFNEEDVASEIADLEIPNCIITKVSKLIYNPNCTDRFHYIVKFTSDSTLSEISKIETLLYQSARWEHLKKKNIFQCRRCQRVGHASSNCELQIRCVRCSLTYEPGHCSIEPDAGKDKLKCANCGQKGHPASYGGCPFLKSIIKTKKLQAAADPPKQSEPPPRTFTSHRISENVSFASALNTSNSNPQQSGNLEDNSTPEQHYERTPLNQPPQQQAHWTTDFKTEISALIASRIALQISIQFAKLNELISENAKRIDILFKTVFSE